MIKYINELKREELNGKKVLLRVDFDVPLRQLPITNNQPLTKIGEDFRIKAQKETIDYLISAGAKVLLVGHSGHDASDASFGPVVEELGEILGQTLTLVPHSELGGVHKLFEVSQLLLLDNIRQDSREVKNDEGLAVSLSNGFDYYVSNAFAVMHRNHASVAAIAQQLPAYAGLLVKKEIEKLGEAVNEPAEGKILILGGAKISTKLPVIKNFIDKAEKILIGGALANNFFQARCIKVGTSVVDNSVEPDVISEKIILPQDVLITDDKTGSSDAESSPIKDIDPNQAILDIGPETAKHYAEIIGGAKIVIWNGPMGLSEIDAFTEGTRVVAKAVATMERSIVGGGDTIAAIDKLGLMSQYDFISTGGGAMLEFLAGNKLPGLDVLG